jgi:hypothetical protein
MGAGVAYRYRRAAAMTFDNLPTSIEYTRAGTLRALAVTTTLRLVYSITLGIGDEGETPG